jgi:ELWxxDGT repeat protein
MAEFHGKLFFGSSTGDSPSRDGLWKSDGTPEGTVQVKHLSTVQFPVVLNDALFFSAFTSSSGAQLWRSDGTGGGTTMVTGNGSGPGGGCCYDMARFGDLILFQAADGAHGVELWRTDGTAEGTVLIKDINPGVKTNGEPRDSNPHGFVTVGGRALFVASQRGKGYELWRTNGTASGTVMVRDIRPGAFGAFLHGYATLSRLPGVGVVFFADDGTHGGEPWRSNGWRNGTSLIEDINGGPDLSGPTGRAITPFGPDAWFAADDGSHGDEPWLTDGTGGPGTHLVDDVRT